MSEDSHVFCIYNVYKNDIPQITTEPDVFQVQSFYYIYKENIFHYHVTTTTESYRKTVYVSSQKPARHVPNWFCS